MDTILRICALAVVSAVVVTLLRRNTPELSVAGTVVGIIALVLAAAGAVSGVLDVLSSLAAAAGVHDELLGPLIKCVGISIVAKIGADMCKDSGLSSFGSYIELAGGAVAIILASPLMMSLLSQITV